MFNNGKKMETTVSGNTVTVKEVNGYGRTTSKTSDPLGNVSSSTDAGGTISFTYNAIGQNLTATYEGNVVRTSYDVWGRKSLFTDPANGTYTYEYTGFGDIKKETSPKGKKQYTYKPNGLLETITEVSDDGTSTNKSITLAYNTKWQLISKSGTSLGKSYQHTYDYYIDGRLKTDIENSNNIQFYNSNISYDSFGKIKRYDKGLISDGVTTSVAIENVYNTWDGSLYQLKQEGTGKILSEIQSVNAKGQILQAKLGASQITNTYDSFGFLSNEKHIAGTNNLMDVSYSFNAIKNELNERHHYNFNIDEYFTYDDNNRLINWTNPRTGQLSNNTYDNKGRITYNDQLGNIAFNMGGNLYRATNLTLNTQGFANFDYNGQSKLVQTITYNENNDPIDINGTLNDYHFEYGLTDSRQVMNYGGNFLNTKTSPTFRKYLNEDNSFEVVVKYVRQRNGALVKNEKHILYIGGNAYSTSIAFIKDFPYPSGSGSFKFLHKDYLGTILAISDETGNAVEKRHFDAWGNFTHLQRNFGSVITNINAINSAELLVDRGYTSHEYLAGVELIHMNGRLYDPLLRRFLNADENIQDPYNTQNYNKYGYVMNNPLLYNDPSGEIAFAAFIAFLSKAVFTAVISSAIIYTTIGVIKGEWSINGFFRTMSFAALTAMATAGVSSIFKVSGFWETVGVGALVGGVGGGIDAMLRGEDFMNGVLRGATIGALTAALGYKSSSVTPTEVVGSKSQTFGARVLRIFSSLIASDKNRTIAGKIVQIASHFTWELPQQILGILTAQFTNLFGGVDKVLRYSNGSIVVSNIWVAAGNGITMGNIITVGSGSTIDVITHEFGHYIQSRRFGPLWIPLFGIPSITRAGLWSLGIVGGDYDSFYTESNATKIGKKYW
jgi:RHS repeat-associated protein